MRCTNCNTDVNSNYKFCTKCGTNLQEIKLVEKQNVQTSEQKRNKKIFLILLAASVIAVLLIILLLSPKNKLKYSWGTKINLIESEEYTTEYNDGSYRTYYTAMGSPYKDKKNPYVICEDPEHTVDDIKEFDIEDDEVKYQGNSSGKLISISYHFEEDLKFAKRVKIAEEYFGDNYYMDELYRDRDRYYADTYWIEGDTVIELSYYGISYYDKDYYFESFGKEHVKNLKKHFNIK